MSLPIPKALSHECITNEFMSFFANLYIFYTPDRVRYTGKFNQIRHDVFRVA